LLSRFSGDRFSFFNKGVLTMKSSYFGRLMAFGPLLLIVTLMFTCAASAEGGRTITVTGEAEVRVPPDEVIITLGVETADKQIVEAMRQNNERVQKVLTLTQSYGIEPKHVQTEYVEIEPRYMDSYEQRDFIGYFARKTIVVTLRDLAKFEGFLTDALALGVNYVHGIEFRTTELRKHRDQARSLAIQAAREKAEALAGELDQAIGRPESITENQNWWWSSYSSWWGSRWSSGMSQNVIQNAGEPAMSVEGALAPGQIVVRASITVSFELKDPS
jgi:uncharacterized protein YggE